MIHTVLASARKTANLAGWLLIVVITALSIVPAAWRPETPAPHDLEHFAIFFLTGIAFGIAYDRTPAVVVAALTTFSGLIEWAQYFVPGRHARIGDFIVDAIAAGVGVAIAVAVARWREQSKGPKWPFSSFCCSESRRPGGIL
jgi:VanZ family protein